MKKIRIIPVLMMALFLFPAAEGICFALQVANESAQMDINGDDAGVCFLITDPQGRRGGYDPATLQHIEEFPASFGCSFAKRGSLSGREETNDKFNSGGMMNLIPGTYTIEIIGVDLTIFDLSIGVSRGVLNEGITSFDFSGVIDKGLTSKFQFTYNSDPSKPAGTATRIVTPSSLKQDINLSRKIGWIDNDGIMNSLLKKVEAIEASIAKGNKTSAKNQLNAFINEVNAQKGKHIASYTEEPAYIKEGSKLVRLPKEGKAVKLLLEDAQYIMTNL